MPVDDFKYLPRSFAAGYDAQPDFSGPVPFTRLGKPVREARIALATTAGIWNRETDPPFDYEREQREPTWGDPSFRVLRSEVRPEQIGAGHLHLNNDDLLTDFNIALPIQRLHELAAAGEVGAVAAQHYSFMGFQGRGADGFGRTEEWEQHYGPEAARQMLAEGVDAAVITPT